MTIPIAQTLIKPAAGNRLFDFDFSEATEIQDEGLTISSATVTATPTTSPALTVGSPAVNAAGNRVQVRVSAGLAGTTYTLTCTPTLSDGSTVLPMDGKLDVT